MWLCVGAADPSDACVVTGWKRLGLILHRSLEGMV